MTACPLMLYDAETANRKLMELQARNAALEDGLKDASDFCHLRRSGFCYNNCKAAILCEARGLRILQHCDLPAEFREVIDGR